MVALARRGAIREEGDMYPAGQSGVDVTVLWHMLGPVSSVLYLLVMIAVLFFAGSGVCARINGRDVTSYSRRLSMYARFMMVVGLASFAWFGTVVCIKLGTLLPELLLRGGLGQALGHLVASMSVALIAHVGAMVLGPPREGESATDEEAD